MRRKTIWAPFGLVAVALVAAACSSAPGQAKGNGLNLSGGVWHEVTASGGAAPAQGSSSGSGGSGY